MNIEKDFSHLKPHFNKKVKSFQKNINTVRDIFHISVDALKCIDCFEKIIPPLDDINWSKEEKDNVTIQIESIDMLFCVYCKQIDNGLYEDCIIARQIINKVPIYFKLHSNITTDKEYVEGEIVFSKSFRNFIDSFELDFNEFKEFLIYFIEDN